MSPGVLVFEVVLDCEGEVVEVWCVDWCYFRGGECFLEGGLGGEGCGGRHIAVEIVDDDTKAEHRVY